MTENITSGAINPYALTEHLIGKRIDWEKVADPVGLVAKTLETPGDSLFSGDPTSPVFMLKRSVQERLDTMNHGLPKFPGLKPAPTLPGIPGTAPSLPALRIDPELKVGPKQRAQIDDLLNDARKLISSRTETEYPNASWTDPGDYFEEGTEFADPIQGMVGDCWLIAALSSVALSRPYVIVQKNRTTGDGNDNFVDRIDFYDISGAHSFEVGETLPVSSFTGRPMFARSSEPGEIWPGMYEKAFARFRSGNLTEKPDIQVLNGGDPVAAAANLVEGTSGKYLWTKNATASELMALITTNCVTNSTGPLLQFLNRHGRTVNPIVAWTYGHESEAPDPIHYDASSGLVAWHAYSILGYSTIRTPSLIPGPLGLPTSRNEHYVVLRNPWGMHEARIDVLSGQWQDPEGSWTRSVPLNSRGVFALKLETFKKYFAGLGVAA